MGVQKGTPFKVVKNTNSHCYPLNVVLTMERDGDGSTSMNNCASECDGNNLKVDDVIFLSFSMEELENDLKNLEESKDAINAKLQLKKCQLEMSKKYGFVIRDEDEATVKTIIDISTNSEFTKEDKEDKILKLFPIIRSF
jgi:guanylate kinase